MLEEKQMEALPSPVNGEGYKMTKQEMGLEKEQGETGFFQVCKDILGKILRFLN